MMKRSILIFIVFLLGTFCSLGQDAYKAVSRYDYYTTEEEVEIAVWVPESKAELSVTIDIVHKYENILIAAKATAGQFMILGFDLKTFNAGNNELTVSFNENGKWVGSEKVNVIILEDRYNAVKIDRVSGGLIVDGLPFIPFGFYAYSPVQPGLAEQEVVKGFNMMSPYQKIEGKTLKERKAYMDRCAAVGMKVNYNLLSLAGGGGVGNKEHKKLSHSKRYKMLKKEIEMFRDHPALLSWYVSDEPVGQGVPPDSLVQVYSMIKELDPYHPVTLVFMTPSMAVKYGHVMDVVMADPYPIPNGKVEEVGQVASLLSKEFFMEKPVWIVPQAFGGNEWWEREPTAREMRAMTYLGIVNNAMGIQYFIRHGLNSFPKSTTAWNECGAMALEIAELTPYLFSAEKAPPIKSSRTEIQLKALHIHGSIVVIAVNTANTPLNYNFSFDGFRYSGGVAVMFEDRKVDIIEGKAEDMIDAYGTRVYRIMFRMATSKGPKVSPQNLILDPSFENTTQIGIPASCYAKSQADLGATYFIDSRISLRGDHSLRMTTPTAGEGMSLSFHRMRIEPGQSYTMSIQAKALPLKFRELVKKPFFRKLCGCGPDEEDYPLFTMKFGGCEQSFIPDGEWKEYAFSCVPEKNALEGINMVSPYLELQGKGTTWFDLIQLYPDMGMKSLVNRENNEISIKLSTIHKGAQIYYSTGGDYFEEYSGNFKINYSTTVKAMAFIDGEQVGYIERDYEVHYATGRYVEYKNKYSTKYDAGLKDGLVDGILASPDFKDGKWQGFLGENLDVIINLKEVRNVSFIDLRFLSNPASWIFLPSEIKIYYSVDGVEYKEYPGEPLPAPYTLQHDQESQIFKYRYWNPEGVDARYIHIKAFAVGSCPDDHPGAGEKAWLFTDEIIIH